MGDRPGQLLLLDTASLYFRAFFGIPDTLRAPDGTPVNAVKGMLDFVARLVSTYHPTALVCCWDDDWRPRWRVELIPTYKKHRVVRVVPGGVDVEVTPDALAVQVPMIRTMLDALGLAVVGAAGYEADDIMGTLATRASGPVDIVTGDRDLFQLVSDERKTRVLYTARGVGNLEIVTDSVVVGKYGVLPEQYADFATLRGDPSDGLPGVAGIGDKTAAGLLKQYGDLAGILTAAADPASSMASGLRARLVAAGSYLAVAPSVVAVAKDVDLPAFDPKLRPLDDDLRQSVAAAGEQWGLGGSVPRVVAALAAATATAT